MNIHLTDEQIAQAQVEGQSFPHLRECAQCSGRLAGLQSTLAGFGDAMRHAGERHNTYWWRQRSALPAAHSPGRWAMATAAVVLAAAVSLPFIHHQAAPPQEAVHPAAVRQISDEALLGEVQSDVLHEYPDAFAPVGTNAETAVATQTTKVKTKEHKTK